MGCQIGSSAATELVDGPPITAGLIMPPAPWTCTAEAAASFAFLKSPIDGLRSSGPHGDALLGRYSRGRARDRKSPRWEGLVSRAAAPSPRVHRVVPSWRLRDAARGSESCGAREPTAPIPSCN